MYDSTRMGSVSGCSPRIGIFLHIQTVIGKFQHTATSTCFSSELRTDFGFMSNYFHGYSLVRHNARYHWLIVQLKQIIPRALLALLAMLMPRCWHKKKIKMSMIAT